MTLNGRYALYCRKDASFGAHHKKINEDRLDPYYDGSDSIFWRYKFLRIFEGVPWEGGVKRQWGNRERPFLSGFAGYFFRHFRDKAGIILYRYGVRHRLFRDPKLHDLK